MRKIVLVAGDLDPLRKEKWKARPTGSTSPTFLDQEGSSRHPRGGFERVSGSNRGVRSPMP